MFDLEDEDEARSRNFSDLMSDEPLPGNFKKALEGETTVTGIVAEGDEDQEEVEVVLAPNMQGHKCIGVVGSVTKV